MVAPSGLFDQSSSRAYDRTSPGPAKRAAAFAWASFLKFKVFSFSTFIGPQSRLANIDSRSGKMATAGGCRRQGQSEISNGLRRLRGRVAGCNQLAFLVDRDLS